MAELDRRADEIFNDALELSPPERGAFLDAVCADASLRADVDSLLASYERDIGFLEHASLEPGSLVPPSSSSSGSPGEPRSACALEPRNESIGEFGHYVLLEELGRGAQGSVYLAQDQNLGRRVALKVLSFPFAITPDTLERFQREAEAASRLDHPGICTVYDAGEVKGLPYIAMRYVEGETLAQRIAKTKDVRSREQESNLLPLPPRDPQRSKASGKEASSTRDQLRGVLHFFEEAARALHVAHEAGLIHRDIKPGNIMIARDGKPVLLDFGLVRDIGGDQPSLTRTGEVMGTPHYMSAEQISTDGIALDRRTDIYSLAVTLYECLTLCRPFEAATREGLYRRILTSNAPRLRSLTPQLPRDLEVVLESALERERDRRYQTAFDFAEDLRRVRELEPIRARRAGPVLRLRRWAQRNPRVAAATVSAFLLLSVSLGTALATIEKLDTTIEKLDSALRHTKAIALAAKSAEVREESGLRSLLLARAAVEKEENTDTISSLYQAVAGAREKMAFEGHEAAVVFVDASPDGDRVVTASEDGTARVWRIDGSLEWVLPASDASNARDPCYMARFSPLSGQWVATASEDGTARIWDVRTGKEIRRFEHHGLVKCVAFSPDEKYLITGAERTVTVCPLGESSEKIVCEAAHGGLVDWVAVSPHGDQFVSVATDGSARLWSLPGLDFQKLLHGPGGRIVRVEFSPDGDHFVTTVGVDPWGTESEQYAAYIWGREGNRRAVIKQDFIASACFAHTSERIVTATNKGVVSFWDLDGNRQKTLVDDARQRFFGAVFSPSDEWIVAYGYGRPVVFDRRGRQIAELRGHQAHCSHAAFTRGGEVLTASYDNTVRLWTFDWKDGYPVMSVGASAGWVWATFSPRGRHILCTGEGASLWDAHGEKVRDFVDDSQVCDSGAFSPDGEQVVICRRKSRTAEIYSLDGTPIRTISVKKKKRIGWGLLSAVFDPRDTSRILTASLRAALWNVDGTHQWADPGPAVTGPTRNLQSARFSADGELFVTAGNDGVVLWNRNLEKKKILPHHDKRVIFADFDPDGRRIITACVDSRARLWDLDGVLIQEFIGHEGGVASASISPDGDRVITASQDGTARLWDLRTGKCLAKLHGHGSTVIYAEFSPDGRRILTSSTDGTARVWPAYVKDLLLLADERAYRKFTFEERQRYAALLED